MQPCCPIQKPHVVFVVDPGGGPQHKRQSADAPCLFGVNMVAAHEFVHGHFPHVLLVKTSQQVVEDTFSHGGFRHRHVLDAQFGKQTCHDGKTACDHGPAIVTQTCQFEGIAVFCLDQQTAQLSQPLCRNSIFRQSILFQDFTQCACSSAGTNGLLPVLLRKLFGDALNFSAGSDFGRFQRQFVDHALGKKAL